MAGVDTRTTHNTMIKNVVLTSGQEWDVINLWIKTHLNTGHAPDSGK